MREGSLTAPRSHITGCRRHHMNASVDARIDRETLALLERLESTPHEAEQKRAIELLADRGDSDSCRVLISAFYRSMWRTTRLEIIRSLGKCDQQRSVECLLHQASQPQDFALAAEAVLSLGRSNSPVAGEFLLTLVEQPLHPLRREAVLALSNMRHFPCDRELAATLEDYAGDLSPGVLQYSDSEHRPPRPGVFVARPSKAAQDGDQLRGHFQRRPGRHQSNRCRRSPGRFA